MLKYVLVWFEYLINLLVWCWVGWLLWMLVCLYDVFVLFSFCCLFVWFVWLCFVVLVCCFGCVFWFFVNWFVVVTVLDCLILVY